MKISASEEVSFLTTEKKAKKTIKVEFKRFGKKDGKYTKERFWISAKSEITGSYQILQALELEDLKNILNEAKKLIKKANSKIK